MRALPALVALACRRPWWTILAALLLTLAALFAVSRTIAMSSDTSALIAPDVPWRAAERRMDAAFPANGDVILVVIDGATPELAEQAAARLTARLAADRANFRSVTRPDGGNFFAREGLLFGARAEVTATTARMIEAQPFLGPLANDPSLRGIADALGTMLRGVETGDATLGQIEPAMRGIATALEAQAAGKPAFFSWQALLGGDTGALAAPRRRLILARPVLDYGALLPGERPSAAIRAVARSLGLDPAQGVTVRLTGSVPLADEEFASLADRWWLVAGAMLAAMIGTLWLATRSMRITGAILATTIAGLIVTTALATLLIGTLNLISVAFIPLFVGLGVDFGIQLSVRFQAERQAGLDTAGAMHAAVAGLGTSLLLAAGAVCLGLLAFVPTAYRGIAELGEIASMGMVVALLASVTLLPALLMVVGTGPPAREMGTPALAPVERFLLARRRLVLGVFALAMVGSIALLPFVRFDFDPLDLRDPGGEAMATLTALRHDPDRNPNTIDILAPNIGVARALAARLERVPEVGRVLTAESFVPEDQPAKLATIADARALLDLTLDPFAPAPPPGDGEVAAALGRTAAALERARSYSGAGRSPGLQAASPEALGSGLRRSTDVREAGARAAHRLAAQFQRLATATPAARSQATALLVPPLVTMLDQMRASLAAAPVADADLPRDIRADWIAADGRARVQVVPKAAYGEGEGLARFTRAVLAIAPDATGVAVSTQGAARTIAMAFIQAGVLALVVVSLLLLAALRNVREVAFTLAPVVLSGFLTLGTCVLIGQPINFANIIAFPLLFGVGVAFHIYFVMAWRGGASDLLQSSLARGVFFSALATGTAFGSLCLSHHPGTASMGKVLMLSLVWTLVCALIFEPALLGPQGESGEPDLPEPRSS